MAITHDYVSWSTGNDYKGATFTDGAFTVADMTLTKAGAFAASKANHWLYLTDNGSNNVTDGYYRIASVTSANAVVLATSPKSGATDPTDVVCTQHAGTTALPWRSDQGACDLLTRNTTDGNQVNILAGAAVVHAASLDLTTFIAGGALAAAAPLILRGYTATANDGGFGEIDCGGFTMFSVATYTHIYLKHLEIHTFGNNHGVQLGSGSNDNTHIASCEIHRGASEPSGKFLINGCTEIVGCYIHDSGTAASSYSGWGAYSIIVATDNFITRCYGGILGGYNAYFERNIVFANSCLYLNYNSVCSDNICYGLGYASGYGINLANPAGKLIVTNNILVNHSGSGSLGIKSAYVYTVGYNAFWNNTANYTWTDQVFDDMTANDVTLAADPFTDAANGDFSLTAAAKTALAAKGWPTSYLGAHANTVPNLNIGPIQMAASAGGGGRPAFGDRSGGKF